MNMRPSIDVILAAWDGRRLTSLAHRLAQPVVDGGATVEANALIDAIIDGRDMGSPREDWSARLKVKSWLIATTATLPDMQYVEGDA